MYFVCLILLYMCNNVLMSKSLAILGNDFISRSNVLPIHRGLLRTGRFISNSKLLPAYQTWNDMTQISRWEHLLVILLIVI